ncbi:MAG: kynurenine 3-monooxygenase [Legionella sp. 40-6]|nr:FAD-dependent monooxygenase [Legionella sp.]OJY23657.1 MAG: kynurenine 3-monooxygenase [Legionella sp. 40-6]
MPKITIIGAGLAGTLLALYLARRGYELDIYESRTDLRLQEDEGGRSINLALSCRGLTSLNAVGLQHLVQKLIVPMRGRAIHDVSGQLTLQPFGRHHEEYINAIERSELNKLLLNEVEKYPNIRFYFSTRLRGIDFERKTLFLETKERGLYEQTYERIIGADGAGSCVRDVLNAKKLIRAHRNFLSYGYKELSIGEAGQNHLLAEHLHLWPRNSFLLLGNPNRDRSITGSLFLPLTGNDSFDCLQNEAQINHFFSLHFADAVDKMPNLIQEFCQRPTGNMSTIQCDSWHYQDQCMLIADAAHGVVPFFGQGMNSAFEDCRILNELLDTHHDSWDKVMPAFYQQRKPNTDAVAQMSMDNFYEIQSNIQERRFNLKKQLEHCLMERYPEYYLSKHVMVMFTNIPYVEAQIYGEIQAEFLELLCEDVESITEIDWQKVEKHLNYYGKKMTDIA